MGKKPLKKIILFITLLISFASCNPSLFQVITHNDVGYWSWNWTPDDPIGSIVEYTKKDSMVKYLNGDWGYQKNEQTPSLWGLKFKVINDTLFEYVNRKGRIKMHDTIPIASYSKNRIVLNNGFKWHRISTRYARKMINEPNQVKLSTALKTPIQKQNIKSIVGVVWKLYGYGDVKTGFIQKSESLNNPFLNIVQFFDDGNFGGYSTYSDKSGNLVALYGEYSMSKTHIDFKSFEILLKIRKPGDSTRPNFDFISFDNEKENQRYDGYEFCEALQRCKYYKIIKKNWLQLFYDDGKKYLLYMVAPSWK